MAIKVNETTIVDDNNNANVVHVSLSSFGNLEVASNTSLFTPPAVGTVAGYAAGGTNPTTPLIRTLIQKFPFASDGNATNTGNLLVPRRRGASFSSEVAGHVVSGDGGTSGLLPSAIGDGQFYSIEKFLFSSDSNSTTAGSLNSTRVASGLGCASPTHGYSGGTRGTGNIYSDTERFSFASEGLATTVGSMQYWNSSPCEFGSPIAGFIATGNLGGSGSPLPTAPSSQTYQLTAIQKYMFSNESDAVQVGDTVLTRFLLSGLASTTYGYTAGGVSPTPAVRYRHIDKMSFASEGTATFVGELTANNGSTGSCTSSNNGYLLGGAIANVPGTSATPTDTIDKFPFATDSNCTDVGDLTDSLVQPFGNQN